MLRKRLKRQDDLGPLFGLVLRHRLTSGLGATGSTSVFRWRDVWQCAGKASGNLSRGTTARRGWTLIEMLVTMMVAGAMTGVSVKMLSTLFHSERTGIEHVTRLTTVSRLSRQFRADIHAATDLQLAGDAQQPLVRITSGDQRQIQYARHPQGLLRTEQRPSRTLNNQDLLRLQGSRFRIEDSKRSPRIVTLIIETPDKFPTDAKQPAGTTRELHIEALLGRDYRDY